MKKRFLAVFLALALGLAPTSALAIPPYGGQAIPVAPPPEPGPVEPSDIAAYGQTKLTGANAKIYEIIKAFFIKIANGEQESTTLKVNTTGMGIDYHWSGYDPDAINFALQLDLPFEQYWYDKSISWSSSATGDGKYVTSVEYRFPVSKDYMPAGATEKDYRIDTAKARAAAAQMKNAQALVEQNSGLSDYDKLKAYQKYICDQVEYDDDAVEEGNRRAYGDPWQLISVFDNNPKTNVVCEGYSKAFKYLCDQSAFTNEIDCYLISGTTIGNHMWNIVRVNGQSYMVDMMACDTKHGRQFDDWFLRGAAECTVKGFTLEQPRHPGWWKAGTELYTYTDITQAVYGNLLILSKTDLDPAAISQVPQPTPSPGPVFTDVPSWCADSVAWAVDNGITTGTGNNKFSPDRSCTHEEILTFLYRTARGGGTATAEDMGKAVDWAREKGMIGASFDPKASCTRAEAVTYIWQAFDKQSAPASSFIDVPAGADYAAAVNWAVANGIVEGYPDGSFRPDTVCSRGVIVTMLHRAYVPSVRLK